MNRNLQSMHWENTLTSVERPNDASCSDCYLLPHATREVASERRVWKMKSHCRFDRVSWKYYSQRSTSSLHHAPSLRNTISKARVADLPGLHPKTAGRGFSVARTCATERGGQTTGKLMVKFVSRLSLSPPRPSSSLHTYREIHML